MSWYLKWLCGALERYNKCKFHETYSLLLIVSHWVSRGRQAFKLAQLTLAITA